MSLAFVPVLETKTALAGNLEWLGINTALFQTAGAQWLVGSIGILLTVWALWAWFWPVSRKQRSAPTYDTHLSEALAYAVTGRWGCWMSDVKSTETDAKLEQVLRRFHQLAGDGGLHTWGKPATIPAHRFGSFTVVEAIPPAHWQAAHLGWDDIRNGYAATYGIVGLDRPFVAMIEVRVNRQEIMKFWPCGPLNSVLNLFVRKSFAPMGIPSPCEP